VSEEKKKSGRFDYVAYDDEAKALQAEAKELVSKVEAFIDQKLGGGRPQATALTNLEVVYMWIGKAVRDLQIKRGGDATDQPARSTE
jgi:hypothetical protein